MLGLHRITPTAWFIAFLAMAVVSMPFTGGSAAFAGDNHGCCASEFAAQSLQRATTATACCSDTPSGSETTAENKQTLPPASDCCTGNCSTCLTCSHLSLPLVIDTIDLALPDSVSTPRFGVPIAQSLLSRSGGPDAPPPCL